MIKMVNKKKGFLDDKRILITGGTGSWGNELTTQILSKFNPQEIIIYSRGEIKQVEMKRRFNNKKLNFVIGDVRNKERLMAITKDIDVIFHLAALKHVPVCEENAYESLTINILGTENIIECAIQNNVKKVVYVSTDKAVSPINIYGVAKAASERLIVNANMKNTNTVFACIRAGNVLGSSGSVIPLFKKQIEISNIVTITDKQMTRFIMSLGQAVTLLLKATEMSIGGEIFVTKMPGIKITNLAKVMIQRIGNRSTKIEYIGIRPGEKLHEVLVSEYECSRTVEFGNYYIILPYVPIEKAFKKYEKLNKVGFKDYTSENTNILNDSDILDVLLSNNFLESKVFDPVTDMLNKESIKRLSNKEKWLI